MHTCTKDGLRNRRIQLHAWRARIGGELRVISGDNQQIIGQHSIAGLNEEAPSLTSVSAIAHQRDGAAVDHERRRVQWLKHRG